MAAQIQLLDAAVEFEKVSEKLGKGLVKPMAMLAVTEHLAQAACRFAKEKENLVKSGAQALEDLFCEFEDIPTEVDKDALN